MNINDLLVYGIVATNSTETTLILRMLEAKCKPEAILERLNIFREEFAEDVEYAKEQAAKKEAAKRSEADKFVRPATKKDFNKSRGAVQTRYRRATLGKFDPSVKADKESSAYDKYSSKAKASKEKKYNKSDDPAGWKTSSQGAGNVVGARTQKGDSSSERGLGGSYL